MGSTILLLFLTVIPIIIILLLVYNKDKNKEPLPLLLKLFVSGIISCILVLFVSDILSLFLPFMNDTKYSSFINVLLYSFIGVALIEELCKWIMVYIFGYRSHEFDEIYDILVYSIFVSLGFAFIENILYVFIGNDIKVALLRAISAIPAHTCDAVFMGYYLSIAKQFFYKKKKKLEIKYIILSIIIPTVLHGIYDFCLLSGNRIFVYVFIIFVSFLYMISINKLKTMIEINKKMSNNKYCPKCGTKVEISICPNCGTKQE